MSTPFPLEEQAQRQPTETWDPWKGPAPPSVGSDLLRAPYTLLFEGPGSGVAKGEAVFAALSPAVMQAQLGPDSLASEAERQQEGMTQEEREQGRQSLAQTLQADARERVKATTPDPATTGLTTQILHGVASGATELMLGSLAGGPVGGALAVGSGEGLNRFQDLREQGVAPGTAGAAATLTGITSAAGAILPAAFGVSLLTRVATGAAGQVGFGLINRGGDHLILEAGGYPEMAAQQKVWDGTQMLVDAALGATFGGVHHLTAEDEPIVAALKENRDAALVTNLALKDRESAPGVPIDPESANAHQAALEKATEDLLQGKPVDVTQTGIDEASFLKRPEPDLLPARQMMLETFKESGLLDEEANLRDLESQLEARRAPADPFLDRLKTDSELRDGLADMKSETGWAEEGGYLIRDPESQAVTGRTKWIPNAEWWPGRPKGLKEAQVQGAIDKALAGERLSRPETRMVQYLMDVHDERMAFARTHAELKEAVQELPEQPPAAVDLTVLASRAGEHDAQAAGAVLDSWSDDKPETLARIQGELEAIIGRGHQVLNLESQTGRVEEPARTQKAPRAADLFGEDRSQEQALADETRRRDALRSPNRDVPLETGRPDDLFSHSRQQLDLTDQPLAERPNLTIPDENGKPVKAAEALEQAKDDTDYPGAIKTAVDCFARRGA